MRPKHIALVDALHGNDVLKQVGSWDIETPVGFEFEGELVPFHRTCPNKVEKVFKGFDRAYPR